MRRSKEDSTGSEKVPYYPDEKFHIVKHKKMQGNNYSLQNPYQGFVPYCADDQILKSCDIKFPLKINLLSVRDLVLQVKDKVYGNNQKNPVEIQKITYTTRVEYQNENIMKLLADC